MSYKIIIGFISFLISLGSVLLIKPNIEGYLKSIGVVYLVCVLFTGIGLVVICQFITKYIWRIKNL
ncbi:hypothetical protein [Mangrovimonas sp. ST2L15]|uniref:hypothetical protein n=1 Tax=Mangrovimonas sp. ST2L15 TaxID=1645916 RepID=UPI000A5FAD16|nr:hypothetical protein [Mangrovimonas sp. ST2L15]